MNPNALFILRQIRALPAAKQSHWRAKLAERHTNPLAAQVIRIVVGQWFDELRGGA